MFIALSKPVAQCNTVVKSIMDEEEIREMWLLVRFLLLMSAVFLPLELSLFVAFTLNFYLLREGPTEVYLQDMQAI